MAETVQSLWQRITGALRRVFHAFESERTETSSTWELTLRTEPDELDGGWTAWVDELPGCASEGATEKEALDNLAEAINLVLEVRIEQALARAADQAAEPATTEPSLRRVRVA